MTLGLTVTSNGGDFLPIATYDARAGRMFKIERVQGLYGWETNKVDITSPSPAFAIDMGSLTVGWIYFAPIGAPDFKLVPVGQMMPAQPSKDYKQGFRAKIMGKALDGLREFAHTAKCVLSSMEELHNKFEAAPEAAAGKIPVVKLAGTIPVITKGPKGETTSYGPIFEIIAWTDRTAEMGDRTVPVPGTKPTDRPSNHVPAPTSTTATPSSSEHAPW